MSRSRQRVEALAGLAIAVVIAATGWAYIGPGHWAYAFVVQGGLLLLGLLAGEVLVDVARARYRVGRGEVILYRLFGVGALQRIFKVIGWDRVIRDMRGDDGGPGSRARRIRGTELSETSHGLGAIGTAILCVAAGSAGHGRGAVQIAVIGLAVHIYPIMLQRLVRRRSTRPPEARRRT